MSRQLNRRRSAFSLVEMLTVIAIIGLLIAILIPAIGHVQTQAKGVQSKATLQALETGIAAYYNDGRIGGGYPLSQPYDSRQLAAAVKNPYKSMGNGGGITGDYFNITGAGLLTWALVGADRLGAPGFIQSRPNSNGWWDDTDASANNNSSPDPTTIGVYTLYPPNAYPAANANQPVFPRSGPFVDMSKVKMSNWDGKAQCTQFGGGSASGSFVVPAEAQTAKDLGAVPGLENGAPQRKYPMFLDGFGAPVLYFRADPTGQAMTSLRPEQSNGSNFARSTYYFGENGSLVDPGTGQPTESVLRTVLNTDLKPHRLRLASDETLPGQKRTLSGGWDNYIVDTSITARFTAQRADSYLLITAGPDGIFGTADDICNFAANGADCARTARTN